MGRRRKPTQKKNGSANVEKKNATAAQKPVETASTTSETGKEASSKESESESGVQGTGINDPDWYTKFPELAFGAGNIPFDVPLGGPLPFKGIDINARSDDGRDIIFTSKDCSAVPGLCSIVTKPSFGFNRNLNDPLNVAASQFYTNVRYVNSGRKNYDACDLMISNLAIADLYSFINWCERIYGYAYMYSMQNRYINEALIKANYVDPDSVASGLANFRYWINTFISRVSAFAVPDSINMFRRRAFMYAHLYTESTTANIKDQLYQFVPDGWYVFALDATGKGMLRYVTMKEFSDTPWTLEEIMLFGDNMLAPISNDEDFGLITGDIIKAYGSNILKLSPCPEALVIPVEYEEYTLSQMRNAHIVSRLCRGPSRKNFTVEGVPNETFRTGDVMQANNGNLITVEAIDNNDNFANYSVYACLSGILTVTNPTPSITDVLEASRLTVCAADGIQDQILGETGIIALYCGSDIVTSVRSSRYVFNEIQGWHVSETEILGNNIPTTVSVADPRLELMHYHWAPLLFKATITTTAEAYTYDDITPLSNVDNVTSVSPQNVRNLHEACLISLLSVPGVATLVG